MPAPKWVHNLLDLLPRDKQWELIEAMELGVPFSPFETLSERLEEARVKKVEAAGVPPRGSTREERERFVERMTLPPRRRGG